MSELRDLAAALSAISNSLGAIEEHVAKGVANGEQLRLGMHDLRNQVQTAILDGAVKGRSIEQVNLFMAEFSRKLVTLESQQGLIQQGLTDTFRGFRKRLNDVEARQRGEEPDEVTQA